MVKPEIDMIAERAKKTIDALAHDRQMEIEAELRALYDDAKTPTKLVSRRLVGCAREPEAHRILPSD